MNFASFLKHLEGDVSEPSEPEYPSNSSLDSFAGNIQVEWDENASVTPLGSLSYFIQFLKLGGRFVPWVDDCPLTYKSNNAPEKVDVLGSLFLSILSGHKRYAHISSIINDDVNAKLLGMNKIVSEDSARRAIKKIDEENGIRWLENHLNDSYFPLLKDPWILDIDTTVKPLYGKQEDAEIGYNPQKPGRPSHTYHTFMMANLRLILNVEVQAGNQSSSKNSIPGLMSVLEKLPENGKPEFVRGDIGFGTDRVMTELESINQPFLFKLKKSKGVITLINKLHCKGEWKIMQKGWEAKEDTIKLMGWEKDRRVVVVRRKLPKESIIGIESKDEKQLSIIEEPENIKIYEYSVLVTDLNDELISIFQHYRDRADCENNFDELKNQWGWSGYTTKDLKSCQIMSRMIALIYNWWCLYSRLGIPDKHKEAITSRPLLLSSVGRLTQSGGQKKLKLTSMHGHNKKLKIIYSRINQIFNYLKVSAPQLSRLETWSQLLSIAMTKFNLKGTAKDEKVPICIT